MYSSTLSLTSALDGVGGKRHAPTTLSPGNTRYPLYRRLGGPQDQSGRVRNISSRPGFDPRIVQPVQRSYTDWANSQRWEETKINQRNTDTLTLNLIYFCSKINQMHSISNLFYFGTTLYMFRTVFPSIIRSLRLYIQHQVYAIYLMLYVQS